MAGAAFGEDHVSLFVTRYFDRNIEIDVEEMTRAKMPVTRACVYHVNNVSAGKSHAVTGEIFAHMLFE